MNCPSCLSRVSRGARMCAVCGDSLAEETLVRASHGQLPTVVVPRHFAAEALAPAASGNGSWHRTADFGSPAELAFDDEPAEPAAPRGPSFCDLCGEGLEPEARFCSFCGTSVVEEAHEPAVMEAPLANDTVRLPRSDEIVPAAPEAAAVAVAPETPTVLRFEPRRPSESAPAPRRAAATAPAPQGEGWLDRKFDLRSAALILAALALAAAFAVHLVGPTGGAGMTEGETEIALRLRAAEWLLGGVLVALIGLLARR